MRSRTALVLTALFVPSLAAAYNYEFKEVLRVMPPELEPPSQKLDATKMTLTFVDTRGSWAIGMRRTNEAWWVDDLAQGWGAAVRRALQDAGAQVVKQSAPWDLNVEIASIELAADMLGARVDISLTATLNRAGEQAWRKNFHKKKKFNQFGDIAKQIAKVLGEMLEDALEIAGQKIVKLGPPTGGPTAPVAAHSAAVTPRLAVLEFRGPLAVSTLRVLADEARGGVLAAVEGKYLVMTRESMQAVLKDMGNCKAEEGECEVETGRNLGADVVVTGEVARLGKKLRASIKVLDTRTGALLASKTFSAATEEDLADEVKATATAAMQDAKKR